MQPLNYNVDVASPIDQALKGYQTGIALDDLRLKRQDAELARQDKERARQLQIEMQGDLAKLAQMQNPTARDYAGVMTRYPQIAEHLKKGYDILQPEQQQDRLNTATQVYSAINSGANDVAIALLGRQAQAYRNSGNEREAKSTETMARLIEMNPATARTSAGLLLSSIVGADKFATMFPALGKETRDAELAPSVLAKSEADSRKAVADANIRQVESAASPDTISLQNSQTRANIANLNSTIQNRSDQLALDRDKLQTDVQKFLMELNQKSGTLPDGAAKVVNDAAIAAVGARQHAGNLLDLATRFEKANPNDGNWARAQEKLAELTGRQDEITLLRKEYTRLRTSDVLKLLPPGPATDKDVKLAMEGFLPDTADAKTMASFLRGMAKISQYEAVLKGAEAEWVSNNHHLGNARKDMTIDGVKVPAGSTFADFSKQFLQKKADALGAEQSLGQAQQLNRGYLRYGTPQPSNAAPALAGGAL